MFTFIWLVTPEDINGRARKGERKGKAGNAGGIGSRLLLWATRRRSAETHWDIVQKRPQIGLPTPQGGGSYYQARDAPRGVTFLAFWAASLAGRLLWPKELALGTSHL